MSEIIKAGPNEIIPLLWVGDANDARSWPDPKRSLCVLEQGRTIEQEFWIPILFNEGGKIVAKADPLNQAAKLILEQLAKGENFLVHCGAGVERSPLTVAWFLVTHHREQFATMADAYALLKSRRSVVGDRQFWLERQP